VLFDTWPVARRVFVVAVLAASIALVAVAVVALSGRGKTRPPASSADVYTRLAQQLKGHLAPLVPANTTTKQHAPTIQIPQQGYSCEIASGTGCSLHPCVKYAQSVSEVAVAVAATATATAGRCNGTANAAPRAVPIVAPAAPVAP
jgi:hypothetical protein